jgi:predicted amidohydrolase
MIDGRKVAFTGDNIFGDPDDPSHTGHEAVVAHNSAILEEGYIYAAEYLTRLKPDILVGGHSFVMDRPGKLIERYRKWSYEMRDAFQSLSPDPDYRYWFDPFWVRAEPYRTALQPGQSAHLTIHVRNFRKSVQKHRIEIRTPPGIEAKPAILVGELASESRGAYPIRLQVLAGASPGVALAALDVTLDGCRYGERFDFLTAVEPNDAVATGNRKPGDIRVAVAQPLVVPGAVETNVRSMEPLVIEAARQNAQLVVFSECGITGYDLKGVGAKAAITLEDPALKQIAGMAGEHKIAIATGFYETRGQDLYNSAAIFFPDGHRVVQRKHNVMAPEKAVAPVVAAERERTIFQIDGMHLALLICADAGIPGIYEELARSGCDGVILIAAGAGDETFGIHQAELANPMKRKSYADSIVRCLDPAAIEQCLRLDMAQVACNQAGWYAATGYFHPGGSSIINRTGEVTAVIPSNLIFERLRPEMAVGVITPRKKETKE